MIIARQGLRGGPYHTTYNIICSSSRIKSISSLYVLNSRLKSSSPLNGGPEALTPKNH